jgi:hypothetical protein
MIIIYNCFLLKDCPADQYKNTTGNEKCQKCPKGKENITMHTGCECKKDHYIGDNEDGPCYGMYINTVNY